MSKLIKRYIVLALSLLTLGILINNIAFSENVWRELNKYLQNADSDSNYYYNYETDRYDPKEEQLSGNLLWIIQQPNNSKAIIKHISLETGVVDSYYCNDAYLILSDPNETNGILYTCRSDNSYIIYCSDGKNDDQRIAEFELVDNISDINTLSHTIRAYMDGWLYYFRKSPDNSKFVNLCRINSVGDSFNYQLLKDESEYPSEYPIEDSYTIMSDGTVFWISENSLFRQRVNHTPECMLTGNNLKKIGCDKLIERFICVDNIGRVLLSAINLEEDIRYLLVFEPESGTIDYFISGNGERITVSHPTSAGTNVVLNHGNTLVAYMGSPNSMELYGPEISVPVIINLDSGETRVLYHNQNAYSFEIEGSESRNNPGIILWVDE